MLSDPQIRALEIIKEHGPVTPHQFALLMWPDSAGWHRITKCGPKEATHGGGMSLAGGGYLGKLRKKGLVENFKQRGRLVNIVSQKGLCELSASQE